MTQENTTPSPFIPVARVAHETQRTVEKALGNHATPVWDSLTDKEQASAVAKVQAYIDNPEMTPVTAIGPTVYAMQQDERAAAYAFYGAVRAIAQEQSRD